MKSAPIIAAFVFPDAWDDLDDFRRLVDALRQRGVNAVFTESEAYDQRAIAAVHERGLKFYAGLACFSDHASDFARLKARPELTPILQNGEKRPQMEWYIGITPTDQRHRQDVLASIGRVARDFDVDGLFLDFVRWPLHWEIELRPDRDPPLDSSFDAATISQFIQATGIAPPDGSVSEIATWILDGHREQWVDFKCSVITAFVEQARATLKSARPDAELGAFIVPDGAVRSEPYTGQRLRDLAPLLDWAAPMLYHNILLQPPKWVGRAVTGFAALATGKTLPVLQVDSNREADPSADWGPPMSLDNWRAVLDEVGDHRDIAGLVVFPGTSLMDSGRGEALRAIVGRS